MPKHSKPIGVLGVNQSHAEKPYRHLRRSDADCGVRRRQLRWISNTVVQEVRCDFWDGWLGTGNLLPFSRVHNKLLKPEPLHYAIPAVGARTRTLRPMELNKAATEFFAERANRVPASTVGEPA